MMIPPFIEVGDAVFSVADWEPDMADRAEITLQRLSPVDEQRYRHLKRESEIELWVNQ